MHIVTDSNVFVDDEDPLEDELAIEEEAARLGKSASGDAKLQDLDRYPPVIVSSISL